MSHISTLVYYPNTDPVTLAPFYILSGARARARVSTVITTAVCTVLFIHYAIHRVCPRPTFTYNTCAPALLLETHLVGRTSDKFPPQINSLAASRADANFDKFIVTSEQPFSSRLLSFELQR